MQKDSHILTFADAVGRPTDLHPGAKPDVQR